MSFKTAFEEKRKESQTFLGFPRCEGWQKKKTKNTDEEKSKIHVCSTQVESLGFRELLGKMIEIFVVKSLTQRPTDQNFQKSISE